MTIGYISVGSNIDRERHIPSGLNRLAEMFGALTVSSVYESEAVGFVGDSFHNLVVGFSSDIPAKDIAKQLKQLELEHGRSRNSPKFSPRTLDLDLILYGGQVINDGDLRLPRDEIERYAFVLQPLAEIAGQELHPLSGLSFQELWRRFDKQNLRQFRVTPSWLNEQAAAAVNC